MKKNQKQKAQQKPIQLKASQIIQLMEQQRKQLYQGQMQYNGMCFMKIPITRFTQEINQYLSKLKIQDSLSFLKCNLETLDGLNIEGDKITNITINYNQIKGDDLKTIVKLFPNVKNLNLRHNQISQLEDLEHLKSLKLENLDLSFNPVRRYLDYKKTIFQYLPQLQNLDNDIEIDDSMDNSSQEMWESRSEEDDESEWNEESEEEIKPKKKVKK